MGRLLLTALNDGGYVVMYSSLGRDGSSMSVHAQRMNADGSTRGAEVQVNDTTSGFQSFGNLTNLADGGYAVVWRSQNVDGSSYATMLKIYDANGVQAASEQRINTTTADNQGYPAIAQLRDGTLVVVWESDEQDGDARGVYARHLSSDGTPLSGEIYVSSSNAVGEQFAADVVALTSGGFVVAWADFNATSETGTIKAQVYNSDATADGANVVLSGTSSGPHFDPELALLSGNTIAASWSDQDRPTLTSDVVTRVFDFAPSFSDGNDYIDGTDSSETMDGLGGDDYIAALSGDDIIFGRDGADWIVGGGGADQMDGGSGTDMVSFIDMPSGVSADMAAGTAQVANTIDTFTNFENLTGSIYGDYIVGDDGNNRIRGLGDYDWMVGSGGADSFDGGTGRDMVSYVNADARVVVDLGLGQGLEGQALGDTYTNVERLTGSIYSDRFVGAGGAEDFRGLGGDDWFVGSGGGKDRYDGGTGRDTVSYSSSSEGISASLLLGRGLSGDAVRDLYSNVENLAGTSFVDTLTGDNTRNVLRGFAGDDVIFGNGGADRITGGRGDDEIDGGTGWDYALFSEDRDAYSVTTNGTVTTVTQLTGTSDGTDTLTNMEVLVFADETIFL